MHHKNDVHILWFIVACFGLVKVSYTHISQGYFTGTGAVLLKQL